MPIRIGDEMPIFDGATEFLNGELNLEKGKPVLVHFGRRVVGFAKKRCRNCVKL